MSTINDWIRRETPRHTELLTRIREKLERALTDHVDEDGRQQQADVGVGGTPSRDWCRAFQRYQTGYATIVQEQREQTKLQMLSKASGMASLTDEEFEREMIELGREAVRQLSADELEAELRRRGLTLPLPKVPE